MTKIKYTDPNTGKEFEINQKNTSIKDIINIVINNFWIKKQKRKEAEAASRLSEASRLFSKEVRINKKNIFTGISENAKNEIAVEKINDDVKIILEENEKDYTASNVEIDPKTVTVDANAVINENEKDVSKKEETIDDVIAFVKNDFKEVNDLKVDGEEEEIIKSDNVFSKDNNPTNIVTNRTFLIGGGSVIDNYGVASDILSMPDENFDNVLLETYLEYEKENVLQYNFDQMITCLHRIICDLPTSNLKDKFDGVYNFNDYLVKNGYGSIDDFKNCLVGRAK